MDIGYQEVMDRLSKRISQLIIENEVLTIQVEKLNARVEELEPKDSDSAAALNGNGKSDDNEKERI